MQDQPCRISYFHSTILTISHFGRGGHIYVPLVVNFMVTRATDDSILKRFRAALDDIYGIGWNAW
jgi:hypothetical protein